MMLERVDAVEARNPRGLGRDVCGRGRGGGGSGGRVCGRSPSPSVAVDINDQGICMLIFS